MSVAEHQFRDEQGMIPAFQVRGSLTKLQKQEIEELLKPGESVVYVEPLSDDGSVYVTVGRVRTIYTLMPNGEAEDIGPPMYY